MSRYPDGFLSELFRVYTECCTSVGSYESLVTGLVQILSDYERGFDGRSIVETPPRNVRGSRPEVIREARYSRELEKVVLRAERELLGRFGYGAVA